MSNEMKGLVKEILPITIGADCSVSTRMEANQQLNSAVETLKPILVEKGIENNVQIVIRVVEFGGGARWHTGTAEQGVPIEDFIWTNIEPDGEDTPMASALKMINDAYRREFLGKRALKPVCILITDGINTDDESDFERECERAKNHNSTRIGIAIGPHADKKELEKFASVGVLGDQGEVPFVFKADKAEEITNLIHWASLVSINDSINRDLNNEDKPVIDDEYNGKKIKKWIE